MGRNDGKKTKHERDHPYGTSLLARDKPENRARWGDQIGYVDVAPTVCTESGDCPHYHYTADATREGGALETPIHMLIASFRDQLCPRTLHNAFKNAENPHRVYIRIIDQNEPGSDLIDDAGCWDRYCTDYNTSCEEFAKNVRTVHVNAKDAKGPTDARSKLSSMITWDYEHKDEPDALDFQRVELQDFCMQIDSHMDFSDNFDTELILMHHRTKNDYAVLSTYVADLSQNNQNIRVVPNLCMVTFTSTIRNWGTKECRNLITPKMTNAMWGAGLSFHRCHAELNVPVDPYLDGVFDGEEGSRGLRFFTHGYDVYSPDTVLVTHDYHTHQSNPIVHTWGRGQNAHDHKADAALKFRADVEKEREKAKTKGTKRVNMLLGIGRGFQSEIEQKEIDQIRRSRFGIGNKRSLEQASKFSGIDLAAKKMAENKCGNLVWVPFKESLGNDYGVSETMARSLVVTDADQGSATAAAAHQELPAGSTGIRGAGSNAGPTGVVNGPEKLNAALGMINERAIGGANDVQEYVERKASSATTTASSDSSGLLPLLLFAASVAAVLLCVVGRLGRSKRKYAKHS